MRANRALKKWVDAQKLPIGHYGRKEARDAVDRIYAECFENEARWTKRIYGKKARLKNPLYFLPQKTAERMLAYVCSMLGYRRTPRLNPQADKIDPGAHAHYNPNKRTIEFRCAYNNRYEARVLIHELCHFFQHEDRMMSGHGKDFVLLEDLAFECLEMWVKNEKRKQEWWA